ncbi:MAG: single-stranded-DNA-specific exonuclease RecJ [Treponema sp.]|nr:MAG: single-stranded-DNA-specific exonuclease RecJ [Treponema sp.]
MSWVKKEIGTELVRAIMDKFGCDALTATILVRRGIIEGKNVLYYLEQETRYLHNPFLFNSMEDAVDRIIEAKDEGERVLIFGDRDVDGITSTVLLYEGLRDFGLDVSWKVPSGDDDYGLSESAVAEHAKNDGTLIITVDCGISKFAEIEYANSKGIDVVVLDHHTARDTLPNATVIVNPKVLNSGYPFEHLTGCAVAWKTLLALRFSKTELYKQQVCLLNVQPVNDAYMIEAVKLVNMVETDRVTETVIPGMVDFSDTRLERFLTGQQIFVWDALQQTKLLANTFGTGIEFNFFDLRNVVSKEFPQLSELSLLRLKSRSTLGKYNPDKNTEIDAFINIFITFVQHSNKFFGAREKSEVQLVALSTLADLMPLLDENRLLVRLGIAEMNKKPRKGIAEILERFGFLNYKVGTHELSWNINPLINATGRMGSPEVAIEMLISSDVKERMEKLESVFKMNDERKTVAEASWNIIVNQAFENFELYNKKVVVVCDDRIHRGVTGLLANRLAETFNVPGIVICKMPDGTAVGSSRSARGYGLLEILEPFSELFLDYGGHDFAAGFSLQQGNLEELLRRLKNFSAVMEFSEKPESKNIKVDAELPHQYLNPDILRLKDSLEPYGQEFPELVFMAKQMKIEDALILGKTERKHLKLTLNCGKHKWSAIYWGQGDLLNSKFQKGDYIDAVFNLKQNYYKGHVTPQMILLDAEKHKNE